MSFLEIACFNVESALAAAQAGADRLEICVDAQVGGLTPSCAMLRHVKSQVKIPVHAMIRPSVISFVYDEIDFEEMKERIMLFAHQQVIDGFVFGILDLAGRIDIQRTSELVDLARPLPCTFHRAFDETPDLAQALEDAITCGMTSILTSGGEETAEQGVQALNQLVAQASGRITIMPGGGVRTGNIGMLRQTTKAQWFHSSALRTGETIANKEEIHTLRETLEEATMG